MFMRDPYRLYTYCGRGLRQLSLPSRGWKLNPLVMQIKHTLSTRVAFVQVNDLSIKQARGIFPIPSL